jgi:hypothetical protein
MQGRACGDRVKEATRVIPSGQAPSAGARHQTLQSRARELRFASGPQHSDRAMPIGLAGRRGPADTGARTGEALGTSIGPDIRLAHGLQSQHARCPANRCHIGRRGRFAGRDRHGEHVCGAGAPGKLRQLWRRTPWHGGPAGAANMRQGSKPRQGRDAGGGSVHESPARGLPTRAS